MYRKRLIQIVDFAYLRLIQKISGGRICVENEASFQLHLSALIKSVGEMYEGQKSEVFSIELEKPVSLKDGNFKKSKTNKAKIDIWISFENLETKEKCSCAIELKYFKKENHREPNNRYDLYSDISNLELYVNQEIANLGFMIIGTNHEHYVNQAIYSQDTADFDFRDNSKYITGAELKYKTNSPYGESISLTNSYEFKWDKYDNEKIYFLKLGIPPI